MITPNIATKRRCTLSEREVELDPRDEHQIQEAELAELGHGRIARSDHVQAVGPDDEPADQETDDPGKPCALEQRRADDHDQEQNQELPRRTCREADLECCDRQWDVGGDHRVVRSRGIDFSASAALAPIQV